MFKKLLLTKIQTIRGSVIQFRVLSDLIERMTDEEARALYQLMQELESDAQAEGRRSHRWRGLI